ncbi:LexA family transcriptional regulator [Dryocola sp. LX212]
MEDKNKLSPRQQEVLALINDFHNRNGFPPTNSEVAELMGFSSANAATVHLQALKRKGFITISKGKARGIQIVGSQTPSQQRDEALAVLRDLFACNVGSAERAAELLSRYEPKGEPA